MRKLLFSRESECIQPLRYLIEKQTHKTLVLWALDCAPRFLDIFEKDYPNETRPRELIQIAKLWAKGEVKMPLAKKAIHAAHNAATDAESSPAAQAAARAIGHAAATIHVETHALGIVFYGMTALVYSQKPDDFDAFIAKECKWFYERLKYWEANYDKAPTTWASFLINETAPNKEALLRKKLEQKRSRDER
jgi:hypothetical protein